MSHMEHFMSKKVAVLLTHDFSDTEYVESIHAYRAAGHSILNIENCEGNIVYGLKRKTSVTIDCSIQHSCVHDFDALFIAGGISPTQLSLDTQFIEFVQKFANAQKPIFSSCDDPSLLIHANIVRGRRLTAIDQVSSQLVEAGAVYLDQDVVNDNNLYVSSHSPDVLPLFLNETLKVLRL